MRLAVVRLVASESEPCRRGYIDDNFLFYMELLELFLEKMRDFDMTEEWCKKACKDVLAFFSPEVESSLGAFLDREFGRYMQPNLPANEDPGVFRVTCLGVLLRF